MAAGACPASETSWSSRGSSSGSDLEDLGGSKVLGRLQGQVKPGTGLGAPMRVGYISKKGPF